MFGLGWQGRFGFVLSGNRLAYLYGRGVAANVAYELFAQGVLNHAGMHALDEFTGGEFSKGPAEGGFAGQCKAQIKAAQAAKFAVRLQAIYQRSGGLQVQHRFGQEGAGQGAPVYLGLACAEPLGVASVTVDGQLDLRELEGSNDLFEFGRQASVVLFNQSDKFALQSSKSLDSDGTQGSIGKTPSPHGRAPSSDFDTLIFQPFRRCPHLFLPQAAVNSTGLGDSASPSYMNKILLTEQYWVRSPTLPAAFDEYEMCRFSMGNGSQ